MIRHRLDVCRQLVAQGGHGVDGVARAAALQLDRRELQRRVILDRGAHQRHAVLDRAHRHALLVRRLRRRDDEHPLQPQGVAGQGGQPQVADVRRVERPAEQTDAPQSSSPHSSSAAPMRTRVPVTAPASTSAASMPKRSRTRWKRCRDSSLVKSVRAASVSMRRPHDAQRVALGYHAEALRLRVVAVDADLLRLVRQRRRRRGERLVERAAQLLETGAVVRRDADRAVAAGAQLAANGRPALGDLGQVELGEDQQDRSLDELRVVQAQLLGDRVPLLQRIVGGPVDDPDQGAGALDVAQEVVSEPLAGVRALDEAGHVGQHRAALVVEGDHAQVGGDGRERVVADLGVGGGERRQQGALPGIRGAHQADVGDRLQLQLHPQLLAGRALLVVRGGAMGGGREVDVAASAASAACYHEPILALHQLADPLRHPDGCGPRFPAERA